MTTSAQYLKKPGWLRFIVCIGYILATIGVLWLVAYGLTSSGCNADSGCSHADQIIWAVIGLADFVLAFVWSILAIKGLLPGVRSTLNQ